MKTRAVRDLPAKQVNPVLYSIPTLEKLTLPPRAETLAAIESGSLEFIDFKARVFNARPNRNHLRFKPEDLQEFAASFKDMPFLRNHDTQDIGARDGTIIASSLNGDVIEQTVRLTTRRGMTDLVEGRIDRFSIGWNYDDAMCSICGSSFFTCPHMPGQTHDSKMCELIFVNPRGKETSAVNAPAVDGTSILSDLRSYKVTNGKPPVVMNIKGGRMKKS